jgi:hypothetical protein
MFGQVMIARQTLDPAYQVVGNGRISEADKDARNRPWGVARAIWLTKTKALLRPHLRSIFCARWQFSGTTPDTKQANSRGQL